jgi:hypothetical protein
MRLLFGAFLVAHGAVHLLYVAHSLRFFELQPGMTWPDGAWALSWLMGNPGVRLVAACLFVLVGVAFVGSGIALAFRQAWWQPVALTAAVVSTVALVLLWNGRLQALDNQGAYAILIDAAILVAVLVFHWPDIAPSLGAAVGA